MVDNRVNLHKYAMHYGTFIGIYWIVKFAFFPAGLSNPFLLLVFCGLTILVPFVGYYFARTYRDKECEGHITFFQSFVFMVFMYMFAALLTAVAHFVYFRFIDGGYIIQTYQSLLDSVTSGIPGVENYVEQARATLDMLSTQTPIELTMQLFTQNVLYCSLIALVTAPFVAKRKPPVQ